ncbi:MAG TPA: cytochrome c5 family protein [Chromatiales bacterium]|nr:cytochrome c5 family protein [Chromatiales bacterium]
MDTLVANAIRGKGAMPPKGGNMALGEAEIRAAIEHMLRETGLSAGGAAKPAPEPEPAPAAAGSAAPAGGSTDLAAGERVYQSACFACHGTGAAGAPKVGDKAAWKDRIAQGMDALVANAIRGKGAMPPKGGRADLDERAIRDAVAYMVSKSR